ncbi:hypothetical protein KQ878_00135 [Mycoplasma zalophidermidis]|uniref:Uncharacterized protein n=1 Tax=Mycoplasma zalophidermidis TaxID=398174 RepID=A0ABS6DQL6_9MOLU|nr:hypothetical protein [Mycoplasma zalophidermidis]MBU4690028.1 hypothetical protein [Mycoplasma zalophidermidis]MBU4693300.1 hypothetical protein [Mycoplasma zalophidermidis]
MIIHYYWLHQSINKEKKLDTPVVPDKPVKPSEKTDFSNKTAIFPPKEFIKIKHFDELTANDLGQSNFRVIY